MKIEMKTLSTPLVAHLEVTEYCNHRCLHCYRLDSDINNRVSEYVSDETVLLCAENLIKKGIIHIILTGGEPLYKKDLVKKIITIAKENKVIVSLNTNLTLLDDDTIDFLKQTKTRVLISCPSAIPTSYKKLTLVDDYVIFENNIKKIISANIKCSFNMVVTKDNYKEVRDTATILKNLGCISFSATPMALNMKFPRFDLLLSIEELRQVIDDLLWIEKEIGLKVDILDGLPKCIFSDKILFGNHLFLYRRCQAGRTFVAISNNGDIRPCANIIDSVGNILEEDLNVLWEKMSDWRSVKYVPIKCAKCTWINRCLGGCRANAKTISGKWDGCDAWITEPLIDYPPLHKKLAELTKESKLKINNDFLYRQEYDDVYVIYNVKNNLYLMINREYLNFINSLKNYEIVTLECLQKKYSVDDNNKSFLDTINSLIRFKIIKIIE